MTIFTILMIFLAIVPISYQIALQRGARNFNLNLSIDIPELIGNLMKGQTTQGPPRPLQKPLVVELKQPQPQPQPPQGSPPQNRSSQALRSPVATIRPPSGPGAPAPPPHPVASQLRNDHHHRDEEHHGSQSLQHDQQSATQDETPDSEPAPAAPPATRTNSHKNNGVTQTDEEDPEADIHAPPPGRVPPASKSHAKAPVQQSGSRQTHQQQHPRFDMSIQADPPQKMRGLY